VPIEFKNDKIDEIIFSPATVNTNNDGFLNKENAINENSSFKVKFKTNFER
jgi:hypothetical protein